jgi:hypothetical protein
MRKIPLVALSRSLAESYGVLHFTGDGAAIKGDGGDIDLVCSQCDHLLATNMSGLPPFANGALRCNSCGIVAHLTRPSHYSEKVSMLARIDDNRQPPPETFEIVPIKPNLGCREEILAVSNDLIEDFLTTQGTRPRILFHYTSLEGFKGIVESGTIWASDIAFLNDTSEISHASKIISEEVERTASGASETVRELLRRANHPTDRNDLSAAFFAICFCESGDLLSQWRAYGDGGRGYALGFDSYEFSSNVYYVRKVVYNLTRQRELVSRVVSDIIALFTRVADGKTIAELDAEEILPEFSRLLSSHLRTLLFSFKHPAFSEEGEWRLIIPFSRQEHLAQMKIRAAGSLLVPYLAVTFSDGRKKPQLPLLEIVQGPSLHPELNKKAAHLLLERQWYEHVELVGSETPLRA